MNISENIGNVDFRFAEQPWELEKRSFKPERTVPVYILQLKRVHTQRFAHDGLVSLCKTYEKHLSSGCPALAGLNTTLAATRASGPSEHLVRSLLGLTQFDGSTSPKSASLHNILGTPHSQRRRDLLEFIAEGFVPSLG